jgi:hypothetical protein
VWENSIECCATRNLQDRGFYGGGKLFLGNKILGNKLNKGKKKLNPLKDT